MYRHPDLLGQASAVQTVLNQKCNHVAIDPPTLDSIRNSDFRHEIESEWANMLAHQLPALPPFPQFWDALDHLFQWLDGTLAVPQLVRAESKNLDEHRAAPRTMVSWRSQAPIELIRFAGANRLKITLDYMAEGGKRGPITVEPYSLRWSRDGNLLLFVVNDHGELRSYRVDRIVGASVTSDPFVPRFIVEF